MGEENVYLIPAKKVQVEKNPWAEFWQPSRCRRAEKATDEVLFRHPEEFFLHAQLSALHRFKAQSNILNTL